MFRYIVAVQNSIVQKRRALTLKNLVNNLVSIITPAYNAEKYIKDTIASVIAQTYTNWEMIIVDDSSNDNTNEIIKEYQQKEKKIRLITLLKNQGIANARNIAIQNARGRYIAFLDSDDIWEKEKLEKQINFMRKNNVYFSYHDYKLLNLSTKKEKIISVPKQLDYLTLLKGNRTGSCLTICLDRKIVDEINFPNAKHEDYICWLNILKKYNLIAFGLNEILGTYKVGKKSITSNKLQSAIWNWQVYRQSQKLSIIKSIYYMYFYIINGIKKYS